MKPKELLSKISQLESLLSEFSYKKMGSDQMATLMLALGDFKVHWPIAVKGRSMAGDSAAAHTIQPNENSDAGSATDVLLAEVSQEVYIALNDFIDFTQLLREQKLSTGQTEQLIALQSAARSLLDSIHELAVYSKLAAGLEQFESIDFNFCRQVRDVVYICKTLIVHENVSLVLVMDPTIPEVLIGDPTKLSQVLLNLLGKVIKLVDKGEINLNVQLQHRTETNAEIAFTITHKGLVMPAEKLPTIFHPLHRANTNASGAYGETGWSLGIVRQLVTGLDGTISTESAPDTGTTFTSYLSYPVGDEAKVQKNDTAQEYLLDAVKLIRGTRILVFEDNPINQHFIKQRLKKWRCPAFVTDCGEYGLGLLEEKDIDMILMDLNLPGMSGLEITESIRKHTSPAIRKLPIIALTADFSIQDKAKCERFGIDDYILKPYSPDQLLLKLLINKNAMEGSSNLIPSTPDTVAIKISEPETFSLDPIFKDCMGQMELVEELVRLYKQNAMEFIGEIKFQLKEKNFEKLAFSLHKMKSGLSMMRTHELLTIVEQMQDYCKEDKDIEQLNVLYECYVSQYPITQAKIDSEVRRLQNK